MKIITLKMDEQELSLAKEVRELLSVPLPVSRHKLLKEAIRVGLLRMKHNHNELHAVSSQI
jgi:hypothetical protein